MHFHAAGCFLKCFFLYEFQHKTHNTHNSNDMNYLVIFPRRALFQQNTKLNFSCVHLLHITIYCIYLENRSRVYEKAGMTHFLSHWFCCCCSEMGETFLIFIQWIQLCTDTCFCLWSLPKANILQSISQSTFSKKWISRHSNNHN